MNLIEVTVAVWIWMWSMSAALSAWTYGTIALQNAQSLRLARMCAENAAEQTLLHQPVPAQVAMDGRSCIIEVRVQNDGTSSGTWITATCGSSKETLYLPDLF
ncbi:hypothetical protein LLE49_02310 [Alicyclobacillus tolerans]|uniref:hypothetical protein n=1 Tax=Alicyclobacillus tolerans TaxID=90970 RepID=UPI001F390B7B|nr:hypothetical protein [Alicyclobacillus tolerans]MCF8563570.1 hypothetical protein [Alicyclobacillus tolerans]